MGGLSGEVVWGGTSGREGGIGVYGGEDEADHGLEDEQGRKGAQREFEIDA